MDATGAGGTAWSTATFGFVSLSKEMQRAFLQQMLATFPEHVAVLQAAIPLAAILNNNNNFVAESPIQVLPEEVLLHIFQSLPDVVDVLHVSLVCKQWGKLSRDKRYIIYSYYLLI